MKIPLNKTGIAAIEKKCRRRAQSLMQVIAESAAGYLMNFGYHSLMLSGPDSRSPGWSAYYAANWNCSVGSVDRTVIIPARDPFDEEKNAFVGDLYEKIDRLNGRPFRGAKFGDSLYVTNSVYYGKWLNDGGVGFLTHNNESHPNRFIELCTAYLKDETQQMIRMVREES